MMTMSEPEANISGSSPNQAEISETSEEADGTAGGGDTQALAAENRVEDTATSDQTFYDIYLVSTSKDTPHFNKMKDMCQRNGWKYTTPFSGKLGEPVMQSAEEAVWTCSHVVLLITEDDCSMKEVELIMTIEMAFDSIKNNKIIPIRCCDEKSLPRRLKQLRGSSIDDDDLEERMIKTIDKRIRKKREAQCHSVSGAPYVRDGAGGRNEADEINGADDRDGADERGGADDRDGADERGGAGGKKKGLTTGEIISAIGVVIGAFALMIGITQTSWSIGGKIGFGLVVIAVVALIFVGRVSRKRIFSWLGCHRSADIEIHSPNHRAETPETSEGADEPLIDQTERSAGAPVSVANISAGSSNQAALHASSEEADGSAGGDQSSLNHQADSGGLSEVHQV